MSFHTSSNKKPISIGIDTNNLERMINENDTDESNSSRKHDINDFKRQHLDVNR